MIDRMLDLSVPVFILVGAALWSLLFVIPAKLITGDPFHYLPWTFPPFVAGALVGWLILR